MKYSLMTPHSEVSPAELHRLTYLLPNYFDFEAAMCFDRAALVCSVFITSSTVTGA
jgi:hypothetical protein